MEFDFMNSISDQRRYSMSLDKTPSTPPNTPLKSREIFVENVLRNFFSNGKSINKNEKCTIL
jgi:hypothetical protein